MTKAVLKNKIRKAIDQVQDEDLLQGVYEVLNSHLHADEYEVSDEDKADLDARLARDKAGLEKGSSWDTVKARIRKQRRIKKAS